MNKSRKLLTLVALAAFIAIVFLIGFTQFQQYQYYKEYQPMQIEWGRGRVWGLTPFGTALSILFVVYIGLFAVLNNDQFLIRWGSTIKRVALGFFIVAIILGMGVISIEVKNSFAERAAQRAWMANREIARQHWQQMSPQERGSIKIWVYLEQNPNDKYRDLFDQAKVSPSPEERARIQEALAFIPEVYGPLTKEELGQKRGLSDEEVGLIPDWARPDQNVIDPSSFPDQPSPTPSPRGGIGEN